MKKDENLIKMNWIKIMTIGEPRSSICERKRECTEWS